MKGKTTIHTAQDKEEPMMFDDYLVKNYGFTYTREQSRKAFSEWIHRYKICQIDIEMK